MDGMTADPTACERCGRGLCRRPVAHFGGAGVLDFFAMLQAAGFQHQPPTGSSSSSTGSSSSAEANPGVVRWMAAQAQEAAHLQRMPDFDRRHGSPQPQTSGAQRDHAAMMARHDGVCYQLP